jgi:acetyltransferase-like isoleucine patch superfamily enzyme
MHFSNKLRLWYVCNVLKIMVSHSENYFENGIYIGDGKHVNIGFNCHINENVFIQGADIGNYVMIAPDVAILSKSHAYNDLNIPMINQGETEEQIPVIEDNVWIGRRAIILPGVRLGSGCIIGAGSVVTRNIPPNTIVGGVPAKIIRNRG